MANPKRKVNINMECPVCNGTGKICEPLNTQGKMDAAVILVQGGMDQRAVQRLLGYKSSRSISYALERAGLKKKKV